MKPLTISAILPNLNMGKFIASALESIAAQSRPVDEVIVIDNQSEDNSLEIIETYRHRFPNFQLLSHDERKPSAVRNVGIKAANSEVLAFLDADDMWHVEKMAIQAKRLESAPAVDAVGSHCTYFDQQHPTLLQPADNARTRISKGPLLGTLLVRRTLLEQMGWLNENLLYGEDWDFYARLRDGSLPFVIQKYCSLFVRRHGNSMMATPNPRMEKDVALSLLQSMLRRRKLGIGSADSKNFSEYEEDI